MAKLNGFIFYRGPSMIDGKPIVAIACRLNAKSNNEKTGALVQTFILRADIAPIDAVNTGDDYSICGACPHRGTIENGKNVGRSCYVTVFQAPRSVYDGFQRGIYAELSPAEGAELLRDRLVRLGSYGDPAAVPFAVWDELLAHVKAKTGYTHQWRAFPQFAKYTMASCDTPQDYVDAKALGFRTFRVRLATDELNAREVICPASKEAGVKTNCASCVACGGTSAKARVDIAIVAHGAAGKINAYTAQRAA